MRSLPRATRSLAKRFLAPLALLLVARAEALADTPDYERDIAPILKKNCMACHAAVMADVSGKLHMETAADLLKGGVSGPAYVAGKSADSLMVKRIEGIIKPKMPLQGELKAKEITRIKEWIDAGAPGGATATPEPKPPEPAPADPGGQVLNRELQFTIQDLTPVASR